jgi:ElaB/YqjD/DUF883 family membrane-anchored ribosome-binding protein
MSSKLKNIEQIHKLVKGEHGSQTRTTVGFSDANVVQEKNKARQVGEVWVETHPITGVSYRWEQKDGYRTKSPLNLEETVKDVRDYLRTFPNCPKDVCTCTSPTHLDKKFKVKTGMCFDCVIDTEHKLKISGKFNEYAVEKMKANATYIMKQNDVEVEKLKADLSKGKVEYVEGADGRTETWEIENPQFLIEQIDEQYNQLKKNINDKLGTNF